MRQTHHLVAMVGLSCVMPLGAAIAGPVPKTDINDIVMYAVESSSPGRLMRYFFLSDTFVPIGEVWTTTGVAVDDIEALAYVPNGLYKGLYGIATDGATEQHLTRIDPLTAKATLYGPNVGGSKITGMIADYNIATGQWTLLASDNGGKLRMINIGDGNATTVSNIGVDLEGLARNSAGVIYGNTNSRLYRLDPANGGQYDAVEIGSLGLSKAESLEFAFGNEAPPIDIPGVDAGWMTYGVLFIFDDDTNKFGIVNPNTGQFMEYTVGGSVSSFSTQDAEGMIFVTTVNDPLYGSIDGFD